MAPVNAQKSKALFDRALLRRRRGRAARSKGEAFLQTRVANNAVERVLDIHKNFDNGLIFAAPTFAQTFLNKAGHKFANICVMDDTDAHHLVDISGQETALPFVDQKFDFVLNGLTLHMANDPVLALNAFARVLKPDGFFMACLFGGQTLNELRQVFYKTEDMFFGRMTPRIIPMIPLQAAAGLLQSAPFAMPVVDRDILRVNYKNIDGLIRDIRESGDTNVMAERMRFPLSRQFKTILSTNYQADFSNANGKLTATFETIWLSAWAPHPDQPKPLKPGTAKMRLADALGVKEIKT